MELPPRLGELQMFRLQQERKSIGTMANQRETSSKKIAREKGKQGPNIADEQKDKYTGKSRGLAYVDFSDDVHLTAALAKNKQMFLNKKLSIARSDPKQRRMRESVGRNTPMEHGEMSGHTNGQTNTVGESESKDSSDVYNATLAAQPQSAYRGSSGQGRPDAKIQ
ncbi:uncharacterized protein LOC114263574 [Camellia sinensis]|uniref:uncharacterized protein LOC114263574 n=1 Tax=Camellia sinensis TaxID=4442 RepID=UPI001036CD65|nr:uncharacterized protein LOC114263574 [Camellia sinensis]